MKTIVKQVTGVELENQKKAKESALRAWVVQKIALAKSWLDEPQTQTERRVAQGAVYKCHLGENIGTEQGEYRPVVVISNGTINSTSGNVTVVPLTKNLKTKMLDGKIVPKYRSHFFLMKQKYSFLEMDSAALCEETKTVSKVRLQEYMGKLDDKDLSRIRSRAKWVLGVD